VFLRRGGDRVAEGRGAGCPGVVETRNNAGDLFGFDRTRAISLESARTIAEAAQRFGQEDDITVMTLALGPAGIVQI
jgi:hypothetical protein